MHLSKELGYGVRLGSCGKGVTGVAGVPGRDQPDAAFAPSTKPLSSEPWPPTRLSSPSLSLGRSCRATFVGALSTKNQGQRAARLHRLGIRLTDFSTPRAIGNN